MILNLLTRQSVATVDELAVLLDTTEITVRRDLAMLAGSGLLRRIRGGAMSVTDAKQHESAAPASAVPASASGVPAIGVMLPEPSFFWPSVVDHIRKRAAHLGFRVIPRESSYEDASEDGILDDLGKQPAMRGLILAPSTHPDVQGRSWQWIARSPLPVVVLERDQPLLSDCSVDSVRTNHPYGVRKAALRFIAKGHRRIGAAFTSTPTSGPIRAGWEQIVRESDRITCPFTVDGIQPYDARGVTRVVSRILATGVTGMLVHSDYLAIAIAQGLERRGKHVPQDVSLISIDGFATPSTRPLTVLRTSTEAMGTLAVTMLKNRIDDPNGPTRHLLIDPMLIDRGSVADLRGASVTQIA